MSKARAILLESGLITPEELEQLQPLGTPIEKYGVSTETPAAGQGDDDKDSDLELIAKVITRILSRLFNLEKAVGR